MTRLFPLVVLLAAAQAHDPPTVANAGLAPPLAALGVVAAFVLAVSYFSRVAVGQIHSVADDRRFAFARFHRRANLTVVAWVAAIACLYFVAEFHVWAASLPVVSTSHTLCGLLILLPTLIPPLGFWAAAYDVRVALRNRSARQTSMTRRAYVMLHLRQSLGLILVPVLLYALAIDLARIARFQTALAHPVTPMHVALAIFALVLTFPSLVRFVWKTEPLPDGPLRDRLQRLAVHAGLPHTKVLLWHTGGTIANAAAVGFLPRNHYILLSDALLARLTPAEIEAAFAHELGHLGRRHLWIRVLAVAAPFGMACIVFNCVPTLQQTFVDRPFSIAAMTSPGVFTIWACGALAVFLLAFSRLARLLECHADAFACHLLASLRPAAAASARAQVSRSLGRLEHLNGPRRFWHAWQHPASATRLAHLRQHAVDPAATARLDRRVRLVGSLLCGLACTAIALGIA